MKNLKNNFKSCVLFTLIFFLMLGSHQGCFFIYQLPQYNQQFAHSFLLLWCFCCPIWNLRSLQSQCFQSDHPTIPRLWFPLIGIIFDVFRWEINKSRKKPFGGIQTVDLSAGKQWRQPLHHATLLDLIFVLTSVIQRKGNLYFFLIKL